MLAIVAVALFLIQTAETPKQAVPNPATLPVTPGCEWISRGHPELVPVAQACEAADAMDNSLPNFICDFKVTRTEFIGVRTIGAGTSKMRFEKRINHVTGEVSYHDGEEEFSDIKVDGKPTDDPGTANTSTWTSGEFSPPGYSVLGPRWAAEFAARGEQPTGNPPLLEFGYRVAQETNHVWRWEIVGRQYHPAFNGLLGIDKPTGFVRRFTMVADQVPEDVPYARVEIVTDYDSVAIAGLGVYQLPIKAVITVCQRGYPSCGVNVKEFSGCRKFAAKARIVE